MAEISVVVLWGVVYFLLVWGDSLSPVSDLWTAVGMAAAVAVSLLLEATDTEIAFDSSQLRLTWLRHESVTEWSSVDSVNYTIRKIGLNRGAPRLVLTISADGTEIRLNEKLSPDARLSHRLDGMELMELYRFVEQTFPDKAAGFVYSGVKW